MYRAGALLLLRRRGRAHARAPAARERTRAAATRAPARQLTPGLTTGCTGYVGPLRTGEQASLCRSQWHEIFDIERE